MQHILLHKIVIAFVNANEVSSIHHMVDKPTKVHGTHFTLDLTIVFDRLCWLTWSSNLARWSLFTFVTFPNTHCYHIQVPWNYPFPVQLSFWFLSETGCTTRRRSTDRNFVSPSVCMWILDHNCWTVWDRFVQCIFTFNASQTKTTTLALICLILVPTLRLC